MFRRWLDSPWPYFVGAGILFLLAVASQFEFRLPSRPTGSVEDIVGLAERKDVNVLFLVVDTLRSDRLGLQGYERPTTPNLGALARQGIVFKNNVAQSTWTKTSMVSLWTGTLPANHGVLRYNHVIPEEATMPAEILKEQGFRTAGVWRNGWVAPNFGFRQGFDVYYRPQAGRERAQIQRANPSSHPLQGTDEDLLVSAKEFLSNFGQERFFLYLHFMDVHQYLYDESSAQFGTSYSDAYDQSILWTDRIIGQLMNTLEEMDISKNTLVVLSSDHGEAFREHGWEGHAKNLYDEVVHVPFLIIPPFRLDPGIVVEERVSNVDVWPTILDMLGLPPLPVTDGASTLPLILEAGGLGPQETAEALRNRVVVGQLDRYWGNPRRKSYPIISITDGSMRFFLHGTEPPREELYDRTADPGETNNLVADGADPNERAIAMRKLADDYFANGKSPWGVAPVEVELDEMQLDQLRALGYVIEGR